MPVDLAVRGDVNVASADLDDLASPFLHEAVAFGDVKGLAALVGVPGGAGTRSEVFAWHPGPERVAVQSMAETSDLADPTASSPDQPTEAQFGPHRFDAGEGGEARRSGTPDSTSLICAALGSPTLTSQAQ